MTATNGQQLPVCAAQLASLKTTTDAMNNAFRDMRQEFQSMQLAINTQQGSIQNLTTQLDKLVVSLESFHSKINSDIKTHESQCMIRNVANNTAKEEITRRIRTKPQRQSKDFGIYQFKQFSKKAKIIIGTIASLLTLAGSALAYFS